MKILLSSYAFSPSVGGIETVSAILADGFVAAGCEVVLVTETPGEATEDSSCRIVRQPSFRSLVGWLNWCDVFLQNNISLRSLIPALLLRRPAAVVHQTWIRGVAGGVGWNDRIKHLLLPRVKNVAISSAIADELKVPSQVIPNPYRDHVFRHLPGVERSKTLVFLGRLVSDKGVDLLLEALVLLRNAGLTPDLTVVGTGSEEAKLRTQCRAAGLDGQVTFAGGRSGPALAEILNQHRILVVPSRWAEPFGVVALEGMACGCVVVASEQGGLKEAIGTGGVTFPNGDAAALADALKNLLTDAAAETALRRNAQAHLPRFSAAAVTQQYLSLLKGLAP